MNKQKIEKFNATQTHNRYDCDYSKDDDGRHCMTRRVDRRIGYIVTMLGNAPKGFPSINALVTSMNTKFKGANYSYNDIRSTITRMKASGFIRESATGIITLSPNGKQAWASVKKVVRGI